MSRILHLINMGLRYLGSKGVRAHRQEEPPLGSLATPCDLEESASHHVSMLPVIPQENWIYHRKLRENDGDSNRE